MSISRISSPKESSPTYTAINIGQGAITGDQIAEETITGDNIETESITGEHVESLSISGKTITADTGTIGGWELGETEFEGPVGAIIRSGQTDFSVGTGFWLGNVQGTPKFSIGQSSGNYMAWDGSTLRVTGAFTPTTVFNTYSYPTASLPIPPTTAGFNNPSGVE